MKPEQHLHNTDEDASTIVSNDNELLESDLQQYSIDELPAQSGHVEPLRSFTATVPSSNEQIINDEEFERNFLRAVDRALGVANRDQVVPEDQPKKTDPSPLNLVQMTEQALSTMNKSALFTVRKIRAEGFSIVSVASRMMMSISVSLVTISRGLEMEDCISEPAVIEQPIDETASVDVQVAASVTEPETIDDIVRTVVEDLILHAEEAKVSSASE